MSTKANVTLLPNFTKGSNNEAVSATAKPERVAKEQIDR